MTDLTSAQLLILQGQLGALNAAIASGATSVRYSDKSVDYRDLSDMMKVRDDILRQIGLPPSTTRRTVAAYNGGFR